jgi:uncharacterized protein YjiS (DUF1127 family)
MTHMTTTHTHGNSGGFGQSPFLNQSMAFAKRIVRRVRERRELSRLLSLPDYLLKDVGLQRHDVQRQALRPLWREALKDE